MPDPCKRKTKKKKKKKPTTSIYGPACPHATATSTATLSYVGALTPPHLSPLAPQSYSLRDRMPPNPATPEPYAPQSYNHRGHMPHSSTTSDTVCPPILQPPGASFLRPSSVVGQPRPFPTGASWAPPSFVPSRGGGS